MKAQFEAQRVIALRLLKLSQGGSDAQKEAEKDKREIGGVS